MSIKNLVRDVRGKLAIRRRLRLTPMHQVLRELKKRKVRLKDLNALEIFGGSGEHHTKDYASKD